MPLPAESLAYAAGFFDGESSISICHNSQRGGDYNLQISITQVHKPTLEWWMSLFGGAISLEHTATARSRFSWRWVQHSHQAAETLSLLMPYLRQKKPQAELALKFQSMCKDRDYRSCLGLDSEQLVLRSAYWQEMRQLKEYEYAPSSRVTSAR